MKARIKGTTLTTEVVQTKGIFNNVDSTYKDENGTIYTKDQLEFVNIILPLCTPPDWFKIYTEISISAMKELMRLNKSEEDIAKMSIKQADSLIKLLREKYENT